MKPFVLLRIAIAVTVVGMALVFIGVLTPSVFYPGCVLIAIGILGVAVSGVWYLVSGKEA